MGTEAGCKGGRNDHFTRSCGAKGAGHQGRGRGRGGPSKLQTQKMRDWHAEPPHADFVDDDNKQSRGRGRSLVTPAWKAPTGLSDVVDNPSVKLPTKTQQFQSNSPQRDGAEASGKGPPDPRQNYRREWLNTLSCAFSPIEVEVLRNFGGFGSGEWLTCQAGELMSLIYARDGFAYAMAYSQPDCRVGWLPVSHLSLVRSDAHYEFIVKLGIPTVAASTKLGLVWAKSTGQLPGLVVMDVVPGTPLDQWNRRCRDTFPRDQVLAGDYITWVDGVSETENMSAYLNDYLLDLKRRADDGMAPVRLKMRVLRASALMARLATGSSSLADVLAAREQLGHPAESSPTEATEVSEPHVADEDPWTSRDPWSCQQAPNTSQEFKASVDLTFSQPCQSQGQSIGKTDFRISASLWQ